jgi:hypothetical protein
LRRIYSSHDRLAVHHARNLLEAEGIRAVVKNEMLSSAMGELPPAECQAELWVRVPDADRAERILLKGETAEGPSWTCSRCSERSGPQFTQCWRCGAYRER